MNVMEEIFEIRSCTQKDWRMTSRSTQLIMFYSVKNCWQHSMNTRETIVKDRSYLTTSSLCQRYTCRRQQQQQQHCLKSLCLLFSRHLSPLPFTSCWFYFSASTSLQISRVLPV